MDRNLPLLCEPLLRYTSSYLEYLGTHVMACIWHSIQDPRFVLPDEYPDTMSSINTLNASIPRATVYIYSFWETITDLGIWTACTMTARS